MRVEPMSEVTANVPVPGRPATAKAEDLTARIRGQVLRLLGEPEGLRTVQVRRLWDNRYRVNVFVGPPAAAARVAHSYFVTVDPDGTIVGSDPRIGREY